MEVNGNCFHSLQSLALTAILQSGLLLQALCDVLCHRKSMQSICVDMHSLTVTEYMNCISRDREIKYSTFNCLIVFFVDYRFRAFSFLLFSYIAEIYRIGSTTDFTSVPLPINVMDLLEILTCLDQGLLF